MPQMAPISWLTLFMLFSFLYILFAILNYFSSYYTPDTSKVSGKTISTTSFNWKW